jgi:enoyl-CoA hydratase
MSDTEEVLFEQRGAVGFVTLNRPESLNALTLKMIRAIDSTLTAWDRDDSVAAVVIRGAGDRAFCAGGDVRAVWEAGRAAKAEGRTGEGLTADFFREEYVLNRRVHRFSKPYIALVDGYTMGGGVGLSVHGAFRVATERTQVAMPETAIGLFPDVGGGYFLPKLKGRIGTYLALTGARIRTEDCLYSGIATAYVESGDLADLETALVQADWAAASAQKTAEDVTASFSKAPGEAPLAARQEQIDRIFSGETMEDIVAALEAETGDWAAETLATLAGRSPTSLKVALEQMRRGAELDFDEAMIMEYRMSQAFMAGEDFYEGIRALLVDKDHAPVWNPATLAGVSAERVAGYFESLGARDLSFV